VGSKQSLSNRKESIDILFRSLRDDVENVSLANFMCDTWTPFHDSRNINKQPFPKPRTSSLKIWSCH
jgi:hypothetical protein